MNIGALSYVHKGYVPSSYLKVGFMYKNLPYFYKPNSYSSYFLNITFTNFLIGHIGSIKDYLFDSNEQE